MAELSPQLKRKLAAATDVCAHLRKQLDAHRLYAAGHTTLKGFQDSLFQRVSAYIAEHEELALGVTAHTLTAEGQVVFTSDKREESLSHALFLDGLERLVFARGLAQSELDQVMVLWRDAIDGRMPAGHNFLTRLWEAGFQHVNAVSIETFAEGEDDDKKQDRDKQQDQLKALMNELVSDKLAGEAPDGAKGPRMLRLTKEDLVVLRTEGVVELTAEDLARNDAAAAAQPLPGLLAEDAQALAAELSEADEVRLERGLHALAWASLSTSAAETEQLQEALRHLYVVLANKHRLDILADAFKHAVQAARAAPLEAEPRIRAVKLASETLGHPSVMEVVLPLLDEPATAEQALAALRFLQPAAVTSLLDMLRLLQTKGGRTKLVELLKAAGPKAEEVAARLEGAPADLAVLLLGLVKESDPQWWALQRAGLAHEAPEVRRAVATQLSREKVLEHRAELYALAGGDDAQVRHALLPRLVAARDRGVVPLLEKLLSQHTRVDAAERKSLLVALGMLGGEQACALLRKELTQEADGELKAAAALALGQAGDQSARPLLESFAKKVFGGGHLKDACAEALKRLDAQKAPGGAKP